MFKGGEIIDLGIRIEQNGAKFYSALAKTVESEKAREIFRYLAEQEKVHEQIFRGMLDEVGAYQPAAVYEQQYGLYMQTLADGHVFTGEADVESRARAVKSLDEALTIGIGFEKDSILLFAEIKNFVPESQHRTIQRLVDEEKKHLLKLTELKKS